MLQVFYLHRKAVGIVIPLVLAVWGAGTENRTQGVGVLTVVWEGRQGKIDCE